MADQIDFSYNIGYMGVVKLADSTDTQFDSATPLLATGGNMTVQQTPIFTTGVWGAGWYNAAQQIAYAPNFITTSGSVNYQLTKGDAFTKLNNFALQKRNQGAGIMILPNGTAGYKGKAWCQSLSLSASQDAIVTGDFNFKTGNVTNCISTTSPTAYEAKSGSGGNLNNSFGSNYLDVFPFWATGVAVQTTDTESMDRPTGSFTVDRADINVDVTDWNASYSSELVLVATCAGYQSLEASQQAKYAALGTMTAQGSFTLFGISSDLNPQNIRKCRKCQIYLAPASNPSVSGSIQFGGLVFSNGSTDIQTGSSFIQSSFNFTALGDGTNPIMKINAGNWDESTPTSDDESTPEA